MALNSQLYTQNAKRRFKQITEFCARELGFEDDDDFYHFTDPLKIIATVYKRYIEIVKDNSISTNVQTIDFSKRLDFNEYENEVAKFLRTFEVYTEKKLAPFSLGVFLHGSLATNDYTGFSDVDVGIFVKNEVMVDASLLKKLQKRIRGALRIILRFDNLQHHGLFIIPECFMMNYPEEYLPIEVFKYSKVIGKIFKVRIYSKKDPLSARKKLFHMVKAIEKFHDAPKNLYELKHKVSMVMLLPTLFLQANGRYLYKKFSFETVKKELPNEWWIIDDVSDIRSKWLHERSPVFSTLVNISPNIWYPSALLRKINWHIPKTFQYLFNERFTNGLRRLMSAILVKIENEI